MEFYKQILPVSIDRKEKRSIFKALAKEYTAVIDGADDTIKARLNRVCMYQPTSTWDIFRDKSTGCLLYLMIPEHHKHIEVGCFSNSSEDKKVFDNFKSLVRKVLSSFSDVSYVRWKQFNFINDRFNILNSDSSEKLFTTIDPSVITYLKEPFVLDILRTIGEGKTSLVDNIAQSFANVDLYTVITSLADYGLINKSFFIYCRNNNQQIIKVTDLDSTRGLLCPFCGRLVLEEKIDQVLSITEEGKRLIKNNFWLSLYVGCVLLSLGIYQDNISFRYENDLKDSDIFVSHFGKLIYIGIKEGPITKDDIFAFSKRAEFYAADKTVLITDAVFDRTDLIFFNKSVKNIKIINHHGDLKLSLKDVLDEVKLMSISDSVKNFGKISHINLTSTLIDSFFKDKKDNILAKLDISSVNTSFLRDPSSDDLTYEVESENLDDEVLEYEEELIDEVISSNSPFVQETEEEKENISFDSEQIESSEELKKEEVEVIEEQVADEPSSEFLPNVDENIPEDNIIEETNIEEEEELDLDDDDDDDYLIGETIKPGFQPKEKVVEIPTMSDYDTRISDICDSVYEKICNLWKNSIINNYSEVENTISTIDENIGFVLTSQDGFSIISNNCDSEMSDTVSAYCSELFNRVSEKFVSISDKKVKSIFVNSTDSYMSLLPVEEGYMTFKCKKEEGDTKLKIQSSEDVRNSLADRVFDVLKTIESIKALLLFDESSAEEKLIGSINSLSDVKNFVFDFYKNDMPMINKVMGDNSVNQICIVTDSLIYSFVFFEEGTVFVSLIDATAGKEIWYLKIMESAKLIA